MRVYVATKIANKEAGVMLAYKLTKMGVEVTSRWLEVEKETRPDERVGRKWEEFAREWGQNDAFDVLNSDVVVVLSVPEGMRGTWVEFGMALAANKKIHWVGDRNQTVFTWLDATPEGTPISYHRDAEEFLAAFIAARAEELKGKKK